METMPITYDIRNDTRFKQGSQEGKLEGKLEEATIKSQEFVISFLENGMTSIDSIANLVKVSVEFVQNTQIGYEKALVMLRNKNHSIQKIADETGLMLEVVQDLKRK